MVFSLWLVPLHLGVLSDPFDPFTPAGLCVTSAGLLSVADLMCLLPELDRNEANSIEALEVMCVAVAMSLIDTD